MQENKQFFLEIKTLKDSYGMSIPENFIMYLNGRNKFDFSGKEISYPNGVVEFNNFILSDTNEIQDSILKWYVLNDEKREDYLTFAFGGGNDEIAIKVSGNGVGGIYHIYHKNDESLEVEFMFNDWLEFEKHLNK